MSEYKIIRWDVIAESRNNKVPIIYIKPNITFLEFVRANSFTVLCEISGTNTKYDNKQISGVVDKSSFIPNCHPNFSDKTGWYVVTLGTNWHGYPNIGNEGIVKFYGLEKPIERIKEQQAKKRVTNTNIPRTSYIYVCLSGLVVLFVLFLLSLLFSYVFKENISFI